MCQLISVICNSSREYGHCKNKTNILLEFENYSTHDVILLIEWTIIEISRECDDRSMIRVSLFTFVDYPVSNICLTRTLYMIFRN